MVCHQHWQSGEDYQSLALDLPQADASDQQQSPASKLAFFRN